ncbi:UDP-glucose 4-epimerase [Candidatus Magnetomorum sp. HK-1]|nr:UDP-glucose 4-epimerase [Candidatus Magnetomorum sp. HK-1]
MGNTNKKKVLVTGAGGALAQRVINKLKLRREYDIIGVGFKESTYFDDTIINYRIDFSKRGFEMVFREHQLDGVIHLGRILLYEDTASRRYNINVIGSKKIFDLSLKYGVNNNIVLSTFYVYGAHPYNPSLIDEMFPLKASNNSSNLADAVELEYLSSLYMLKYPELKTTILRPCNILGPGVQNSVSLLLNRKYVPCLLGFSPIMQFIHVDDLAEAIVLAYEKPTPGVYNVVTEDWLPYQKAITMAGGFPTPIPPFPPSLSRQIVRLMNIKEFPDYLLNYYKYPVVLDGSLFNRTYPFKPRYSFDDIFNYYKRQKNLSAF